MRRYFRSIAFGSAIAALAGFGLAPAAEPEAEAEVAELTIGSQAPALDIEHWLHEGDDKKPVTEFQEGQVYVVEFWATWCGPCINSMPHLAELQKTYADRGVRIVSISDEDLETVEAFLEKPTPQDEDVTFAELTSAYSLTTDPDQSAFRDYMQAAGQTGIPAAFIVGKSGLIEWLGHPMLMDEPLEEVVTDSWDREAFAKEYAQQKANEEALSKAMQLARSGETAEAVSLLDERIAATTGAESLAVLKQYKLRILMSNPEMGDQAVAMVQELLDDPSKDPLLAYLAASATYQLASSGDKDDARLTAAVEKLRQAVDGAEARIQPALYDTMARLLQVQGKLEEAIAAEQEAVKRAEGPMASRFESFLEELRQEAEQGEEPETESESESDE